MQTSHLGLAIGTRWSGATALVTAAASVLGVVAIAALVQELDAPLALGALAGGLAVVALILRPYAAIPLVAFLLYLNVPGVAVLNGIPQAIAAAFVGLLFVPLVHDLIVHGARLRVDLVLGLMTGFLGVMALSSLGAVDANLALARVGGFVTSGLLIYWLFINVVRSRATLRTTIWAAILAGGLLGGLSLFQSVTGNYTQQFGGFAERQLAYEFKRDQVTGSESTAGRVFRSDRADGPLLGSNRYAQVMVVLLPLAVFAFRRARSSRERLVAVAAGVCILSGVILTYSRGAMLIVALLLVAACLVKWLRPAHLVALALAGLVAVPILVPSVAARVGTLGSVTEFGAENPVDGVHPTIAGRATEMMAALYVFLDYPALGVGPAQYTPFYSQEYQQIPEIQFRELDRTRRAHSMYPEIAAETGLIGLTVFLAIPAFLFVAMWRHRRVAGQDSESADLAAALALSILAYMGTALFLHLSYERYYWFLLALAGAALEIFRREQAAASQAAVAAQGEPGGVRSARVRGWRR